MTARIYIVTSGGSKRLVKARTPAAAIRHVTRSAYVAEVAGQDELVALVSAGVKVEDASEQSDSPKGGDANLRETGGDSAQSSQRRDNSPPHAEQSATHGEVEIPAHMRRAHV